MTTIRLKELLFMVKRPSMERKVVEFGNSGHICVPKEYIGKHAIVLFTD